MPHKIFFDEEHISPPKPPRYVYVAAAANHGGLKIGSTISLKERLANLRARHGEGTACGQRNCPRLSGVELVLAYANAAGLEGLLHAAFKPWRIHGEWFDVSVLHVEAVADVLASKMEDDGS